MHNECLGCVKIGQDGEAAANITKNTKHVVMPNSKKAYRIPDIFDEDKKIIGDVKNVKYQHLSTQLKEYLEYAESHKYTFVLYIRKGNGTTLSSKLLQRLKEAKAIINVDIKYI